jgi:aminopeptidase N
MLARAINGTESLNNLHVINRAQLMNDALALARAKYVSYPVALDTTNYLEFETEYLPWATAFSSLAYISDRLNIDEGSRNFFEVI